MPAPNEAANNKKETKKMDEVLMQKVIRQLERGIITPAEAKVLLLTEGVQLPEIEHLLQLVTDLQKFMEV